MDRDAITHLNSSFQQVRSLEQRPLRRSFFRGLQDVVSSEAIKTQFRQRPSGRRFFSGHQNVVFQMTSRRSLFRAINECNSQYHSMIITCTLTRTHIPHPLLLYTHTHTHTSHSCTHTHSLHKLRTIKIYFANNTKIEYQYFL